MIEVSKVTARFGNMNKLVPQILEPTIGKKVMPDILITGGGGDNTNSSLSGLLGMKLMEELGGKTPPASTPPSAPQPSFSATPAKPFEPLT